MNKFNVMINWRMAIIGGIVALAFLLEPTVMAAIPGSVVPSVATGSVTRLLRYGFELRNTTAAPIPIGELWVRVPLSLTPWQRCDKVSGNFPAERSTLSDGGQMLQYCWTNIPPYATREFWVEAVVEMGPQVGASLPITHACEAIGLFDYRAAVFKQTGFLTQAPGSVSSEAGRVCKWVFDYVHADNYSGENRGALYALQKASGDCSEKMSLFVALMRRMHVPSLGVGGVPVSRNTVIRPTDYHNWAVYRDGRAWEVCDPSLGRCGAAALPLVAFEWIDGDVPSTDFVRRYRVRGEGLTARMK